MQIPPMYSALKVNGKKLYELARAGKEIQRQPRPITIHTLELLEFGGNTARLRVRCSKGTYIRTLCKDIGAALGCGGCMAALRRVQAGEYTIISDCYNAGPESMAAALKVLGNRKGRRIAVLGDMLELGDVTWAEHFKIGRIAAENAEAVYAFGPNANRVTGGAVTGGMNPSFARHFDSREEMAKSLKRLAKPGDTLLFKASRGMHLELVLEEFLKEEK